MASLRGFLLGLARVVVGCLATSSLAQDSSFIVGDRITIDADLVTVRAGAGLAFATLGSQKHDATGTVVTTSGGLVDGYLWLQINFDGGTDGWSAQGDIKETFIRKLDIQPEATPTGPESAPARAPGTPQAGMESQAFWATATVEDVQRLSKQGVDWNQRGEGGETALMYAAAVSQDPEVITQLIRAGADSSISSADGKTAFDYAVVNEALNGTNVLKTLAGLTASAASPSTSRVGMYMNTANGDSFLKLAEDGTFFVIYQARSYAGTYQIDGNVLALIMSSGLERLTFLDDATILDNENERWVRH